MKIEIYRDHAGEWRWRLKSANNRVIADSGESFTRKRDARRSASLLRWAFRAREVVYP